MDSTDLELLRAYVVDGDEGAFAELVRRHRSWIVAAARRRLGDEHLADDAAQAVMLILAQKASHLAGAGRRSVSAWLFHTLHFVCLRVRRTRGREVGAVLHTDAMRAGDRAVPQAELLMLLEDTIAHLPPATREAIVRRFYQGADHASIGRALGITADAARKRIGRALNTVRDLMVRDGVDAIPDELLGAMGEEPPQAAGCRSTAREEQAQSIAQGAIIMAEQAHASEFQTVSTEFYVKDVEPNLEFFENLGFRQRWAETPDAMGRIPRAALAGGAARIWLRRASQTEGTRPMPGVNVFFWVAGGPDALAAHRARIVAQGIAAGPMLDDHTLRNFTVTTPDGYRIGFFTQYRRTTGELMQSHQ